MNYIRVFDFTEYPALRYYKLSDDSGEAFYHEKLNNAFKSSYEKGEKLTVDLDNTAGYPPSFIDEAFGNLVYDFGQNVILEFLIIKSDEEPDLIEELKNDVYPAWEARRNSKDAPTKTKKHDPWYALEDGNLIKRSN